MKLRLLGDFVSERVDEIGYAIGRTVELPVWVRKGLTY